MEFLEILKFGFFAAFVTTVTYFSFKLKKPKKHLHHK